MPVYNFGQPDGGIIQTAFITDDIQRAMADMTRLLNIGPWFVFEHFELSDLHYLGRPTNLDITLALANSGHMQFELIQQLDNKPSPYQQVKADSGWGFHHFGVAAADFDRACGDYEQQGFKQVLYGVAGVGARAAYYDTRDPVFGMIEVIELVPAVEELWTMVRNASVGWNGEDPVRSLG
tara:strand:+ start:29141 stop:29680 length:540 start_codon:yes stop_codon:yes gene_type:complete